MFNNVTLLRSKYCCVLTTRNSNHMCASWKMRSLVMVSLKQRKRRLEKHRQISAIVTTSCIALRITLDWLSNKKKTCAVKNWWFHNICMVAISKVFTIFADQCSEQKKQIVAPKEAETQATTFHSWEISQHPNHNVRSRDRKIFNPA